MTKSAKKPAKLDAFIRRKDQEVSKAGWIQAAARQVQKEGVGSKGLTVRLHVDAWKQLKLLALERGTTAHALLLEGLNTVFEKHGLEPRA